MELGVFIYFLQTINMLLSFLDFFRFYALHKLKSVVLVLNLLYSPTLRLLKSILLQIKSQKNVHIGNIWRISLPSLLLCYCSRCGGLLFRFADSILYSELENLYVCGACQSLLFLYDLKKERVFQSVEVHAVLRQACFFS